MKNIILTALQVEILSKILYSYLFNKEIGSITRLEIFLCNKFLLNHKYSHILHCLLRV